MIRREEVEESIQSPERREENRELFNFDHHMTERSKKGITGWGGRQVVPFLFDQEMMRMRRKVTMGKR